MNYRCVTEVGHHHWTVYNMCTTTGRHPSTPGPALCRMYLQLVRYFHLLSTYTLFLLWLDFYLIDPPSGALHKPVPPSKLVLAGDSAGAGLCITVLTVLRDLGLPQPAGAVLISPWVDLTHSFPSVMKNTMTVRINCIAAVWSASARGSLHSPM